MKTKVILFGLDGTLLPMDQDVFVKTYFGLLAKKLSNQGYEPNKLVESVWLGTKAMVKNDGKISNEEAFWNKFAEIYGEDARKDIIHFDKVQISCGYNKKAKWAVNEIKKLGYGLALATNPILPKIATEKRISWAGLNPNDFELYTTHENLNYSKPNLKYYEDILSKLNIKAEECLMVGNDVNEDMVAKEIGINVFLLTDCIINKENKDISSIPQGNFEDLLRYIQNMKI